MERRALTRYLRLRPTTSSILYTRQYQRSLLNNQFLRFNSNSSSSKNPAASDLATPSKSAASSEQPAPQNTAAPKPSPYTFKKAASTSQAEGDNDAQGSINGILQKLRLHESAPAPAITNPMRTDVSAQRAAKLQQEPKARFKVNLHLGPSLGRTVDVDPGNGIHLQDALRRLQGRLAGNNVRIDSITQKEHIRKGMMRKILRRRRWRKLFKFSFQHTLAKVERMRKQGW
ncbi:hypothetical protein BJY01DRAFT_203202 [Aspergillus pseudoustus]|uniref:Ribosomal protein S21 n=1 Tax=Aspergillus pseudoustus TaxID=1810923 RepID=A0ABR4KWK1_9EURO